MGEVAQGKEWRGLVRGRGACGGVVNAVVFGMVQAGDLRVEELVGEGTTGVRETGVREGGEGGSGGQDGGGATVKRGGAGKCGCRIGGGAGSRTVCGWREGGFGGMVCSLEESGREGRGGFPQRYCYQVEIGTTEDALGRCMWIAIRVQRIAIGNGGRSIRHKNKHKINTSAAASHRTACPIAGASVPAARKHTAQAPSSPRRANRQITRSPPALPPFLPPQRARSHNGTTRREEKSGRHLIRSDGQGTDGHAAADAVCAERGGAPGVKVDLHVVAFAKGRATGGATIAGRDGFEYGDDENSDAVCGDGEGAGGGFEDSVVED